MKKRTGGVRVEEPQKTKKRPRSFVLKITVRQILRMAWIMIVIDVLVIGFYFGATFIRCERAIGELARLPNTTAFEQTSVLMPNITIFRYYGKPQGWNLSRRLAVEAGIPDDTVRHMTWDIELGGFFNKEWDVEGEYTAYIPTQEQGEYLAVRFDLAPGLYEFRFFLNFLFGAQGLLLLFSAFGIRRSVRKTLAPIHQLTMATRNFSAEQSPAAKTLPQSELELTDTIHTLNSITAKKLDTRISLDDEQTELRGLAGAINNMLDRLDAAYQSQLRFVSDASHELRTPIAVIQGYANLLDRWGKEDPDTLQESIGAIKAETEGMQALVEQLLFLARSDNNSIVLDLKMFDISTLATEVLRDTQVIDQTHELVCDIDPDLWITGDMGLLKQALRIFMDNAIKYTPAGERIKVSVKTDTNRVLVSVSDNGIGIPEQDLPHVFERFYRSDESRARKTGGTGLGLAIAKWTVQRHGGYMEILSRKDIGTKLTMSLPSAQINAQELPKAQ